MFTGRKWEETEDELDDAILMSPSGTGGEPDQDPLGLRASIEYVYIYLEACSQLNSAAHVSVCEIWTPRPVSLAWLTV